jgi:hypothetical protein
MLSLLPVLSLLLVIVVSLLVVRIATVALVHTGLSHQLARFQARSAFTGAGFTTSESEKVTHHPVRRRIILLLMLLGNAGIVTAMSSLMLSFLSIDNSGSSTVGIRVLTIAAGIAALWGVAHSGWIDRHLTRLIEWSLKRWTDLDVRDYSGLLHLAGGYAVVELEVEPEDWMAKRQLQRLKLSDEGVLILGVERPGGHYVGAPRGSTRLEPGDTVIMYGPRESIVNLDERRAGSEGNWEHVKAVDKQMKAKAGNSTPIRSHHDNVVVDASLIDKERETAAV